MCPQSTTVSLDACSPSNGSLLTLKPPVMPDSTVQIGHQCDRCQFFAFSEFLVCSLHPSGPRDLQHCSDFDPWPDGKIFWAPVGSGFYEVAEAEDFQLNRARTSLSLMEQLEKIEAHPIFSGRCPQCGHKLGYAPRYLWNCDRCGWQDDLGTT